jgi:hypothetical protein
VAVSPDGKNVYVAADAADTVTAFDRARDGSLVAKPDRTGCLATVEPPSQYLRCLDGSALDDPRMLALTPDGDNAYVLSSVLGVLNRAHTRTPVKRVIQVGDRRIARQTATGTFIVPDLEIACPAGPACRARITVSADLGGASAARTRRIGRGRFTAAPGSRKPVRFRLNRTGRRLVRDRKRVTATLTVVVRRGPDRTTRKARVGIRRS